MCEVDGAVLSVDHDEIEARQREELDQLQRRIYRKVPMTQSCSSNLRFSEFLARSCHP
ncbi:MAG: hypothetical protein HYZ57_16240 [Acidobacteria bacterium]|nr:hypothetical protein [Acidobacteriota bacterium]MBI3281384.1 hypothetical protein [Acidobacteriota bacterium]